MEYDPALTNILLVFDLLASLWSFIGFTTDLHV